MAPRTISIAFDFPQPTAAVFKRLSEHDKLGPVLGMPCKRIKDGSDPAEPDGLGSVRRLSAGPLGIEETITAFEKNRLIEYRITKGGFMKHHLGVMRFSERGSGTRLDYTIEIESALPLVTGPLVKSLERTIRHGLQGLADTL